MWSTVEDYAKFCQMLLTGKTPTGAQILRPSTMKADSDSGNRLMWVCFCAPSGTLVRQPGGLRPEGWEMRGHPQHTEPVPGAHLCEDGRLPGWHDADGKAKGGMWDFTGWSLLKLALTLTCIC